MSADYAFALLLSSDELVEEKDEGERELLPVLDDADDYKDGEDVVLTLD